MKYQLNAYLACALVIQVAAQEVNIQASLAPINPAWTKQYNLSKVPNTAPKQPGTGVCAQTTCGPGECEKCWESCGNCAKPEDVYGCKAGQWALSFDDGPSEHTAELLDILKAANVKATFLMIGSNVVKFPDVVKRAYSEGHQISQHTWSHPHLMSLSNEQIVAEIRAAEDAILNVTGVKPAYIRPPYGEADDRVKAVMTAMGYHNLLWNMDTLDWDIVAKNESATLILKSFQDTLSKGTLLNAHNDPGYISLQHDLYIDTVKQVPQIQTLLASHGFHFVLSHECTGIPPYQNSTAIANGNSTTSTTSKATSASLAPTSAKAKSIPTTSSPNSGKVNASAKSSADIIDINIMLFGFTFYISALIF
ncbi:chitin deacetylase [Basidiobolus ranarum]|uniref:Chitin deacetylase n=1 Tax=Basidiobolus ranarum TaxID=34480 RepID=A0ABR2WUR8_9FUNG